jgi:hypothetical protein
MELSKFMGKISADAATRITRRHRLTLLELEEVEEEVLTFEDDQCIEVRWKRGGVEYTDALQHLALHRYHETLGELERLVVQRLLELTKLRMSGICE